MGRFREMFKKYGKTGLVVYLSISALDLTALYLAISNGVNLQPLIDRLPFTKSFSTNTKENNTESKTSSSAISSLNGSKNKAGGKLGAFAIAYGIHKLLMPIRFGATVAITPYISRLWSKYYM